MIHACYYSVARVITCMGFKLSGVFRSESALVAIQLFCVLKKLSNWEYIILSMTFALACGIDIGRAYIDRTR